MYDKKAGVVTYKMAFSDYLWIIEDLLPKYYPQYKESLKNDDNNK